MSSTAGTKVDTHCEGIQVTNIFLKLGVHS
jgi:hypothetical protein